MPRSPTLPWVLDIPPKRSRIVSYLSFTFYANGDYMSGEGLSARSTHIRNILAANAVDPSNPLWQAPNLSAVVDLLTQMTGDAAVFNALDASCKFAQAYQGIATSTHTNLQGLDITATKSGRYIVIAGLCSRPTGGVGQVNYLNIAVDGVYVDLTDSYSGGDWGGGLVQSYHYDAIVSAAEIDINAGEVITAQSRRNSGTCRCYHRYLIAVRVGDLP